MVSGKEGKKIGIPSNCDDLMEMAPELCANTRENTNDGQLVFGGLNGLCCKTCGGNIRC